MKKFLCLVFVLMLVVSSIAGCAKKSDTTTGTTSKEPTNTADVTSKEDDSKKEAEAVKEEVVLTIPHYNAGENVGAIFFLPQVERFNEKYAGQYKIIIEETPQDSYNEKMKQLAIQGKLPALVATADKQWFQQVAIPNKMYYDLSDWIESKPELKSVLIPESVEFNTVDDAVVSLPAAIVRPIGLYYNSTMLNLDQPIKSLTVDQFGDLLKKQDQKIAFMTSENAWTTSLFLTSIIAEQEGGLDMLKAGLINPVTDYTTDIWVKSFEKLQYFMQNYASSNTVGAAYADAANSFMSKSSAVIPNGSWMVGDFGSESSDKWSNGFDGEQATGDMYPGNVAIASFTGGYGWWIPSNLPENELQAALAFLEFVYSPAELEAFMLAEGGMAPQLTVSDTYKEEMKKNRLLNELNEAITTDTTFVPRSGDAMPTSVGEETFGKLLPKLIDGSLTPLEFGEALSSAAKEAVQ